ncbi:MAG: type II secretion system protein [Opitutaceae bacterium]|nr:type II secretion system protein [Opitutaceae bacterium]
MKAARNQGFTLLETLVATVLVALVMTALCAYVVASHKVRAHVEAAREASYAAHARCLLFADGVIYPNIFSQAPGTTVTNHPALDTLPGGWPVDAVTETVSVAADGQSAGIAVTYVVETASAQTATVTATGRRWQ